MNWPRGLFRLWLVVSALWVVLAGIGLITGGRYDLMVILQALVLPPAVVLVIGAAVLWAFRGFQR